MIKKIQLFLIKILFKNYNFYRLGNGKALKLVNILGNFHFQHDYRMMKVIVNSADKYWLKYIIANRPYEPEIENFLRIIKSNFDFIDIGANLGYWSIFVKRNYVNSSVFAIEPNPERFQLLNQNVLINHLEIKTLRCGISRKSERNSFYLSRDLSLHASASKIGRNVKNSEEILIDYKTLDDILAQLDDSDKTIVIKLDVEGAEHEILQSSFRAFKDNVIIIFEQHGRDLHNDAARYILSFSTHNLYLLKEDGPIRIETISMLEQLKTDLNIGYNCVAIPRHQELLLPNYDFQNKHQSFNQDLE